MRTGISGGGAADALGKIGDNKTLEPLSRHTRDKMNMSEGPQKMQWKKSRLKH
jgi:hypothetical protein